MNNIKNDKQISELEQYKYDCEYVKEKKKELEDLVNGIKDLAERLRFYKDNNFNVEEYKERLDMMIEKSNVEEKRLLEILERKQTIEEKINLLDQPYRNVLYLKYIRAYTIDEVALNMNYSSKRIYQLHRIALEKYLEVNGTNISSD